jgi:hypothetical protein
MVVAMGELSWEEAKWDTKPKTFYSASKTLALPRNRVTLPLLSSSKTILLLIESITQDRCD